MEDETQHTQVAEEGPETRDVPVRAAANKQAKAERVPPEKGRKSPKPQAQIQLPIVLMMGMFAIVLDLADLGEGIPVVGSAIAFLFNVTFGPMLWVSYWAAGARGSRQIATMAIGFFMEQVPGLSVLPLNTITVIGVYLMSTPETQRIIGAASRRMMPKR
ncbi:MAG: hypothetical protein HYS57_00310 [Parcubacteria group bacterium]|nr:hypothetical protein [Parcubacteria group bacterium]